MGLGGQATWLAVLLIIIGAVALIVIFYVQGKKIVFSFIISHN